MLVLLLDPEPVVKRAILKEISRFCVFFGRQIANDVLLSHIITYLNDANWELRCSFFESVVGIATFLGSKGLEEYLLPLIMQSIHDAEEFVVQRVLKSLISLSELRLIEKTRLREILGTVLPLMCHPNPWIRNGTQYNHESLI